MTFTWTLTSVKYFSLNKSRWDYMKGSKLSQSISDCGYLLINNMTNSLLDIEDGIIVFYCFPISEFDDLKSSFGLYHTLRSFEKMVLFGFMQDFRCLEIYVCHSKFIDEPLVLSYVIFCQLCVFRRFASRSSSYYHWVCGRKITYCVSNGLRFSIALLRRLDPSQVL